jgi:hypothetical protein
MTTNFKLRSLALDDDAQGCRFDATPAQFELLGRGTPELITDFLLNMQVEAEPSNWSVAPFRTYYYSQSPDAPDWSDVFPRAFEVRVRFAKPFVGPRPDPFRQWSSPATDPTWDPMQLPLEWTKGKVIIVADCFRRTREELLAALDGRPALKEECERVELVALRPDVLQMRMDVGERRFPDDQPRVYSLMEEASHFCRSFTWEESVKIA